MIPQTNDKIYLFILYQTDEGQLHIAVNYIINNRTTKIRERERERVKKINIHIY